MKNKKGSAYILIYGLFFLLVIGFLYIVFNQIAVTEIRPVVDSLSLNFSQESKDYADKYLSAWKLVPFLFVFIIGLYFIIWIGFSKDRGIWWNL